MDRQQAAGGPRVEREVSRRGQHSFGIAPRRRWKAAVSRALASARVARPLAVAALALAVLGASAGGALAAEGQGEGFGIEKWEAGTCSNVACTDAGPAEYFYTQAAGHPQFGITDFRMNSKQSAGVTGEVHIPEGHVDDVRVDLPEGLAVDPEAAEECSGAALAEFACPAGSQVGEDEATGTVALNEALLNQFEKLLPGTGGLLGGVLKLPKELDSLTVTEKFKVYNAERLIGEPARFAVEVNSPTLKLAGIEPSYIFIEGALSWYHEPEAAGGESSHVVTGNYHEYFKIPNIPQAPEVVESKLIFWGRPHEFNAAAPEKTFITMPSECTGPQVTLLHLSSHEEPGRFLFKENLTPVGATGCATLPNAPKIEQKPETTQADAPDGTTVILRVPQGTDTPSTTNSPTVKEAVVTLPEGMTLNPSAANGLEACPSIGIGTNAPISCPAGSVLGTVNVDAPGIPNGSLTGHVYLGTPQAKSTQNPGEAESGHEYRIFVAAESPRYGVGVRLEGRVSANERTGRLSTTFSDLPNVPFEAFELHFDGGPKAPLANPLACGPATTAAAITPFSGQPPALPSFGFGVTPVGGGACAPPPFAPGQGTASSTTAAAADTSFTLGLARPEGQQYLSSLSTQLPLGLVGRIANVPLCEEPNAAAGTCTAASQIGTAAVAIGSGPQPYSLSGPVYLTGPYDGAPFGMSIVVPATKVGPFDYGNIVTRASISIDPHTARVSVASTLPSIVGGAPLRIRGVNVDVNRPSFLVNPTSCGQLSTETSFVSTLGGRSAASTPFQASGCGSLPFAPKLTAKTNGRTSRKAGASLQVTVTAPEHEANIREVRVTLPKKIVARLATLGNACLLATFEANPASCPEQSKVGNATVSTPLLPGKLEGAAYFVSLGHEGFPNLDLVLKGDGVTFILVGSTEIRGKYTHSNFTSVPDVPFSTFTVTLPQGRDSALSAAKANLCKHRNRLRMTASIIAQNGARLNEKPKIAVGGCHARKHHRKHGRHRRHHGKHAGKHGKHAGSHAKHAGKHGRHGG